MNISLLISSINTALDKARVALQKLPGTLLLATCSRRPGFSSILSSAKAFADMNYAQDENDEIVKEFTFNLINRIKENIHDDGVCFVIIPPGGAQFQLNGGNAGGPAVLTGSNTNYAFCWAIIR